MGVSLFFFFLVWGFLRFLEPKKKGNLTERKRRRSWRVPQLAGRAEKERKTEEERRRKTKRLKRRLEFGTSVPTQTEEDFLRELRKAWASWRVWTFLFFTAFFSSNFSLLSFQPSS